MPLPFGHVCELLEQCSKLCAARQKHHPAVIHWFRRHRALIDAHDTSVAALLSTLLPDKRTDRVYCIQAPSLEKIIGRALMLGSSRMKELALHKVPGKGVDLADCVEQILIATPNPKQSAHHLVTVDYVDTVLHSLASRIKWSSPKVRSTQTNMTKESRGELEALYLRFTPIEAKWFTRLVLKNYEPLIFQSDAIYALCDRALPSALKILDDFVAAIEAVQDAKTRLLPTSSRSNLTGNRLLSAVKPQHGIKIGRQPWLKARSIKHCLDMGRDHMSVERKIDGEYCQIHVDLSNSRAPLQIFSKSGKDSTEDRKNVHSVIMDSLRQGQSDFTIKQKCILEGELVVYSDREMKIRPFHAIRNYVTRRGRFMNTEQDSQPKSYEHLMIVYFDVLSIDNDSLLGVKHSQRRQHLERIVKVIPGRSEVVSRQVIDFSHRLAASHLRKAFAAVIMQRGEGLVLKADDPYFDFSSGQRRFASSCIKMKKEYIGNFGEIGDFAVVGAGFDPVRGKSYRISGLRWTHFYLGCLNNREEVVRWAAKPDFTVVCLVEMNETQLRSFVAHAITDAVPMALNQATCIHLPAGLNRRPPLQVAFTRPPVVDVRCFSFDKEGNTGFWTPRFPGISKIHFDREFADTISFDELQSMAKDSTSTPELEDSQENLQWIARLERADPRGLAVDAMSQLTASSLATLSPRRRTQSFSEAGSPRHLASSRSQPTFGRAPADDKSAIPLNLTKHEVPPLTPPTSSAPQEPVSEPEKLDKPPKRLSSTSLQQHSPKRRCLNAPILANTPVRRTAKTRPPRKPLGDIEGNSSQRSTYSGPPIPASQENHGSAIDLTTSAVLSPASTCSDTALRRNESEIHIRHDTTVVTIPDSDEANHQTQVILKTGVSEKSEPVLDGHSFRCSLSGAYCNLLKAIVALAPTLQHNDELSRQLKAHGIFTPLTDLQAFAVALWGTQDEQDRHAILLVDSVGELQQTRDILDELDDILDRDTGRPRAWVHVYDWHVLMSITTLEDGKASNKDLAGFSDPWRRWQVGII